MKRILFVDDERAVLEAMQRSFRRRFDVVIAGGGVDGLAMLQADPTIAVVVSDMRMPGMDGAEFLATVRKRYPNVPCIMLTGSTPAEYGTCVPVFQFLAKPISREELQQAIECALEHGKSQPCPSNVSTQ